MVHTPDGPQVDAVAISIEEASRDSRRLILDLMEMQQSTKLDVLPVIPD